MQLRSFRDNACFMHAGCYEISRSYAYPYPQILRADIHGYVHIDRCLFCVHVSTKYSQSTVAFHDIN